MTEMQTKGPSRASVVVGIGVNINADSAIEWLNNGAQMTETVQALFSAQGVLARWKGQEGTVREDALSHDKPKRRRKLAASAAAEEAAETPAEGEKKE